MASPNTELEIAALLENGSLTAHAEVFPVPLHAQNSVAVIAGIHYSQEAIAATLQNLPLPLLELLLTKYAYALIDGHNNLFGPSGAGGAVTLLKHIEYVADPQTKMNVYDIIARKKMVHR